MAGPIQGVNILDFGLYGVGPIAAAILGAMGANVIKIERPEGDPIRSIPPLQKGLSAIYTYCNLNKRAAVLDLKTSENQALIERLIREADVIMENLRPGVADKLGFGYERVLRLNPRIVYGSFPGFGAGAMQDQPCIAMVAEAFSGSVSVTGDADKPGEFSRYVHVHDHTATMHLVGAILLGLLAREISGKSQFVSLTQIGNSVAIQLTRYAEFFASGKTPPRLGSACSVTVPHEAFICQDKKYLAVGVTKDEEWVNLCKALGAEDLATSPEYALNRDRVINRHKLIPRLSDIFRTKPARWWCIRLEQYNVPHGYFYDFDVLRYHPQVLQNDDLVLLNVPHQGPVYVGGIPVKFSRTPATIEPAPYPGQHTEEIKSQGFACFKRS